ncbi:hypothetical protein EDB86DRAFT_3242649 [Lactarius hatsudake]|nr:hypothetical protein EDB86DRAFT_3242649 [Lactarius hatsudake]
MFLKSESAISPDFFYPLTGTQTTCIWQPNGPLYSRPRTSSQRTIGDHTAGRTSASSFMHILAASIFSTALTAPAAFMIRKLEAGLLWAIDCEFFAWFLEGIQTVLSTPTRANSRSEQSSPTPPLPPVWLHDPNVHPLAVCVREEIGTVYANFVDEMSVLLVAECGIYVWRARRGKRESIWRFWLRV